MASTLKLFYDQPRLFEAEARVVRVRGPESAPVIELDSTIFYPEGGGQACDLGAIGGIAVSSVVDEAMPDGGAAVLHALAAPCDFREGELVRLSVDRARRIDYSQQHTAEHVLGALALRLLGARVSSVHFGPDRSLIDFEVAAFSDAELAVIEDAAAQAIAEDHPLRTHLCPPEDISLLPLRRPAPAGEDTLRVVEIEGLDFTACCGLHLQSTLELRAIRILGAEKYKGMTRVFFVAGARAAADYLSVSRIAREAARALGTSVDELPAAARREAERRKELEFSVVGLERERAEMEAAAELSRREGAADSTGNGLAAPVVRRYADRSAASLMESAKAFAALGLTSLLASLPEHTVMSLAPSPKAALGERLKPLLASTGGKGGGGPSSFRAAFSDQKSLEAFMAMAEALLNGDRSAPPH